MDSRGFYKLVKQNIKKAGQHLQMVLPSEYPPSPPFVYTIGNRGHDLPELLIVGFCEPVFGSILNDLGERMRKSGRAYDNGELVSLGGAYPVKIIDVPTKANEQFAVQVGRFYQTGDFRLQQVVLCDPKGHFPGDAGCSAPFASQTDHLRAGMN